MASSMIHIVVANEVNKKINRNKSKLLIGSIAPDIGKLVGLGKIDTHFQDSDDNIPNLDKFLNEYKNNLDDDFVLGYYIHLITDYLWFKYFVTEIEIDNIITKLDGTKVKCNGNMLYTYMYNDYTDLNVRLIDEYNLDLKIFYNEVPKLKNIIKEIPMDKISVIVNKAGEIIENSKIKKEYLFNIDNIKTFIKTTTDLILSNLKEIGVKWEA